MTSAFFDQPVPPEPVTVQIKIVGPYGIFEVAYAQQFDFKGRPLDSLAELYKQAHAEASGYVRRQANR